MLWIRCFVFEIGDSCWIFLGVPPSPLPAHKYAVINDLRGVDVCKIS
jgi:hypothetical protein